MISCKRIYSKQNGPRYVFCKDGVYFALSLGELFDMRDLCSETINKERERAFDEPEADCDI